MIPGHGWEVEFERDKWLSVAFFIAVPSHRGDIAVIAFVLDDGRLTATSGKLRRCKGFPHEPGPAERSLG